MNNNHILHHLDIDFTLHDAEQNLNSANSSVDVYRDLLTETVQNYFNQIDVEENFLIENLEIDVGNCTDANELKEKVLNQLSKSLTEILNHKKNHINENIPAENILYVNDIENEKKAVLLFLNSGIWKYDAFRTNFDKLEFKIKMQKHVQQEIEVKTDEEFLRSIVLNPSFFWRIIHYFNDLCTNVIQKLIPKHSKFTHIQELIWTDIIKEFSSKHSEFTAEQWKSFFQQILLFHQQSLEEKWILLSLSNAVVKKNPDTDISSLPFSKNQSNKIISAKLREQQHATKLLENYFTKTGSSEAFENLAYNVLEPIDSHLKKELHQMEELHIVEELELMNDNALHNCGILLLHPYLTSLFEEIGILKDKKFKNRKSQIKALQLMFYICTFKENVEEYEILFFKILVGLPINEFIIFSEPITISAKQKCRNVIEKLIEDWKVLKKTSLESVQQNFLQRKALLFDNEQSIEVHLETSSFDVLLEHLPFNFSIIKTPWNHRLFFIILK